MEVQRSYEAALSSMREKQAAMRLKLRSDLALVSDSLSWPHPPKMKVSEERSINSVRASLEDLRAYRREAIGVVNDFKDY
jgi:hypothetical protein